MRLLSVAARLVSALLLASLCALPLGGCGGGGAVAPQDSTAAPRRGGTAVVGSISDVDAWNEYVSQQSFAGNLLRRIFLRLAQETAAGAESPEQFEPLLAESWEFSADGMSLTFRLREATWSDGVPIGAEDVRFTWQAQTSPDVPWISASSKSRITDVEVLDARTVRFVFDGSYPYQFADAVEGGIVPRHVFGTVPFDAWATHDWSQPSIGSGPFLLERHDAGREIALARNPRFFAAPLPHLDRVVVRIVPDVMNLLTQLRTGEIDYLEGIPPRDAHALEQDGGGAIALIAFDYPKYDFIGWNLARVPFSDRELRRALTLALDREALVEDLLYGYGRVARAPVPSYWWGADPDLAPWPYDPERAREVLRGRGYAVRDASGALSSGETLRIELLTNAGNQLREDVLVKVQEQFSRVGIAASIRALEAKALRQQVGAGDFDGFLGGWIFVGKVDLHSLFGSAFVPPAGLNVVRYRDTESDAVLERLAAASNWHEMRPELLALQRRIHEDQPYTFLYETRRVAAHGPRLRGVLIDVPADPFARLERFWVTGG